MIRNSIFTSIPLTRKRQSIFVRLFVSFISSSLLIIALIGFIYYEYALQTTEERTNELVENSLRESIALFEIGYQSQIQSHLKMLRGTPSLNNFLTFQKEQAALVRFDLEKQFSQLIRSRSELYRSIRFIDSLGVEKVVVEGRKRNRNYHSIITASESFTLQPQLKKIFEDLKENVSKEIIFSLPFRSSEGQFLFYAGIAKIEPEIGGFGGAIIIECDLSTYIESLMEIRTYGYPIAWLFSSKGEILVKPEDNVPQRAPHETKQKASFTIESGIVRQNLYPGVSRDEEPFLTVVLSIPEEIFHKQNRNILKITLIIALIVIVFTFLVAWLVSQKITKPVTELVRVSQQLAKGDYGTRSVLHDNSEIGVLSRSFNHMAEMLEQSIDKLALELSNRQSTEEALQQSHESLQLILNSTGEGIFGIDADGNCTFCNPSALKLLGYNTEQELVGHNMHAAIQYSYVDGQSYSQFDNTIYRTTLSKQEVHVDNEVFWRADKTYLDVEYRAHPVIQDGQVAGAVVSFSDISNRKQQEKKILYQAHYDMLTGLPNRFLAMDRLDQMLKQAVRHNRLAAVLFLDLDGFKKVNDMLGHEAGDKLLVESAHRLSDCLRSEDTGGRLGGDEFIVLLSNLKEKMDAQLVAEKILEAFRRPFKIVGHELLLTTSIGIAIYPSDTEDITELLRNADIAMYESKQSGRNTYQFFTEEFNTGIQRRLEVEEQLHHALDRDEFYLVYQPIVDIQTMDITGAEVLLRWYNQQLGMVFPDEFIPITEQTGLIVAIGDYILDEAIAQTTRWQKKYSKDFKISVNVSPRQLHNKGLFTQIVSVLEKYKLEGQNLQLELTEGVLMNQNPTVTQELELMRESQIKIAMDDFGTGYSSLSYLRNYPFDSLKIDRSFVRDLHLDNNDRALVMATLNMSHALGVKVVAEGIENNEQLQFLIQVGCEYGQGYLFSKPIRADEFEAQFLKNSLSPKG